LLISFDMIVIQVCCL